MKKNRIVYAVIAILLFISEIIIGLCFHSGFIRSYFGDVLITVLLCCIVRIIFPKGIKLLPIYVFVFATLVEIAQYFDVVKLLGLESNQFISVLVGRWFSYIDIICYGAGCIAFWLVEFTVTQFSIRGKSL